MQHRVVAATAAKERWRRFTGGVLALALLAAGSPAWGGVDPGAGEGDEPAVTSGGEGGEGGAARAGGSGAAGASGAAELAQAAAAKKAAYALSDDARTAALLEAARAYAKVASAEGHDPAVRAEAAFRAGEILRAQKQVEEATGRFVQATRVGEDSDDGKAREFAARGLLEQAHLLRRAGQGDEALALYAQMGERFADQRRQVAHAATWAGKVLLKDGRLEEAAAVLMDLDRFLPEYPLDAIRNVDALAVALVEAGSREQAEEALDRLRERLRPIEEEGGRTAERVASALGALRATILLSGY